MARTYDSHPRSFCSTELADTEPELDRDALALRVAEEWVTSGATRHKYHQRIKKRAKRHTSEVITCYTYLSLHL